MKLSEAIKDDGLGETVRGIVSAQAVTDLHTHCYAPAFGASPVPGGLLLWGIDELVTYHYLIAEAFRARPPWETPYERFWGWSKPAQADYIWRTLFVERTPLSEACRGVVTTLTRLGLDPNEETLEPYRRWFAQREPDAYIDQVMDVAGVDLITMTNEVFSDHERAMWLRGAYRTEDPRFAAVLRIDRLLNETPAALALLHEWGYATHPEVGAGTIEQVRRFLSDWIDRMRPAYIATSLDSSFTYPDSEHPDRDRIIRHALMPVLRERGLAWALMIGARRGVNPLLREGGDASGRADITAVTNLCGAFPDNRFLVTMLARENQHELCVAARKFGQLMPFGCWWFLNNPSLIEEITRMRLELLGTSFIPQHSDARILDQLIYKWDHSRAVLAKVLTEKYADLQRAGRKVTRAHIERDAAWLLRGQYRAFVGMGER